MSDIILTGEEKKTAETVKERPRFMNDVRHDPVHNSVEVRQFELTYDADGVPNSFAHVFDLTVRLGASMEAKARITGALQDVLNMFQQQPGNVQPMGPDALRVLEEAQRRGLRPMLRRG